jgi:hypothetical protein
MRVTATDTTTQVLVRARTALTIEDVEFRVGSRRANIKTAAAYWVHEGEWKLEFVHIEGPVLLTTGRGGESRVILSRDTLPARPEDLPVPVIAPRAPSGRPLNLLATPEELVDALIAAKPAWEPTISPSPHESAVLRGVRH